MLIPPRAPRESGREYALRVIRDNILHLELAPGSMVSENELGAELGLSRTPVREALVELSKLHLVEIYPQRGSVVSPVDYETVEETCFMRLSLEREVVKNASLICKDEEKVVLVENILAQECCLSEGGEGLMQLDNELHHLLFRCARKERLWEWMKRFTLHFDRVRLMSLDIHPTDDTSNVNSINERNVADHRAIVEAVLAGDADRAAAQMERHLTRYRVDEEAMRAHYPPDWFR